MGRPRKFTPWFEGHVKPERPGVYEVARRASERTCYPDGLWRYWNGKRWHTSTTSAARAPLTTILTSFPRSWRGLTNPPRVRK